MRMMKLGVVVHTCIPAPGKAEAGRAEFKVNLFYKVSPGQPQVHRETQSWNPLPQKNKTATQKKK